MGAITKWSFLLFSSLFFVATLQAQYPATGNKMRLGWQTTGDGLVYRGAISDTSTLDPSGLNNAWMLLDTVSGSLYAYRSKAWQLVSGGGGGITMPFDSVTFNINEGDASEQELKYSAEKGYLQYGGLDSVQIPLLPGIWYVRNDTSVTIPKGTVVRATGTLGASGRIKVKHMIANGTIPAMYVLGIAMHDIAVGADGYVMTQGKIRQVNTTAYSNDAVLYADVDTLGGLTQTEPGNGYLKLPIAFVVHSASNGTLAVRIDAGSSLHDLHDVDTAGRVDGSVLRYDSALKYWKASTTAGVIGNGSAGYLSKFTGASSVGNSPLYNPSSNKIMLGHTTANVYTTGIEVHSATSATPQAQPAVDVYMGNNTFVDYTPRFNLYRNKGTTIGSFSRVQNGDWLGRLVFHGADSSQYVFGAQVYAIVDGATSAGVVPTALRFATNPGNSITAPTDRMSITSAGRVGIGTISPARSLHINATDAVRIPVGTAVQRGTGANGDVRFNSDSTVLEFYDGTGWRKPIVTNRGNGKGANGQFYIGDASGFADISSNLFWTSGKLAVNRTLPSSASDSTLYVNGGATITGGLVTGSRVGIGTTSPDSTLHVSGGVYVSGVVNSFLGFESYGQVILRRSGSTIRDVSLISASNANNLGSLVVYPVSTGTNAGSALTVTPKGTGLSASQKTQITLHSTDAVADATNTSFVVFRATGSSYAFMNAKAGSGSIYPIFFNATGTQNQPDSANIYCAVDGKVGVRTSSPTAALHVNGSLSRNAPVTVTDATHTVAETTSWLICNRAGTITLTLPTASSWTGREIMVKTITANTVTSAAANVVPIDGDAAANAILPATDGAWATLVSNGTNWVIMQQK